MWHRRQKSNNMMVTVQYEAGPLGMGTGKRSPKESQVVSSMRELWSLRGACFPQRELLSVS